MVMNTGSPPAHHLCNDSMLKPLAVGMSRPPSLSIDTSSKPGRPSPFYTTTPASTPQPGILKKCASVFATHLSKFMSSGSEKSK